MCSSRYQKGASATCARHLSLPLESCSRAGQAGGEGSSKQFAVTVPCLFNPSTGVRGQLCQSHTPAALKHNRSRRLEQRAHAQGGSGQTHAAARNP
jgi:hypothetical protein